MLCNQRDRGHHVKRAGLVGETRLGLVTLRLTRAPLFGMSVAQLGGGIWVQCVTPRHTNEILHSYVD